MAIEGVLADDLDPSSLVGSQTLPNGFRLFHCLRNQFQVVLSTLGNPETAQAFLQPSGIKESDYSILLSNNDRISHLRRARQIGFRIEYLFDSDPDVAVAALRLGCVPMCCPHPAYGRSSFLPDAGQGKRSWAEIVAEVQGQRGAKSVDPRLTNEEVVLRDDN